MNKSYSMSLIFLAGLSSSTAMASTILTCTKGSPHPARGAMYTTINLQFSDFSVDQKLTGNYAYDQIWNGAFPTDESDHGLVTGTVSQSGETIEGHFSFTAFNAASSLDIHQSVGTIKIAQDGEAGDESDSNFHCSVAVTNSHTEIETVAATLIAKTDIAVPAATIWHGYIGASSLSFANSALGCGLMNDVLQTEQIKKGQRINIEGDVTLGFVTFSPVNDDSFTNLYIMEPPVGPTSTTSAAEVFAQLKSCVDGSGLFDVVEN
jgi:hypothetical protein